MTCENFRLAVEFDAGRVKDKNLGEVHLSGNILCVLPSGLYPDADKKGIDSADQRLVEWAVKIGLIKEGEKYYNKFCKNYANFTALTVPDLKLDEDRMLAYMYLMAWFFTFDDVLDNTKDHRSGSLELVPTVEKVIEVFIDIFKGKYVELKELPVVDFPLYMPLCHSLLDFNQLANKCIISYPKDKEYFVEGMANYLNAVMWEHKEHSDNEDVSETTYLFRRRHTIGVPSTLELIALMKGLKISKELMSNLSFVRLREAGTMSCSPKFGQHAKRGKWL